MKNVILEMQFIPRRGGGKKRCLCLFLVSLFVCSNWNNISPNDRVLNEYWIEGGKSRAPDDGYINVRNMLSIEEVK